jgi:hypothetical protein
MPINKHVKVIIFIFFGIILIALIANGYAGDQFGEYLNDQVPSDYSEATGWRKITGYILTFLCLLYMGRQIWKDLRKKYWGKKY